MFVFDLFEKKKQDPAAGRFVGGTSQDARVKNALDNAYRAVPAAKSPEEAALGYIDIQNSLNQKQDQVLSQQNKTNQQQTQQINALVADMRRKEKDFRDLNAQVASMPNVTPQQVAKMAQDIEAAHDAGKDEPVDVPSVIAKQTTVQPAAQVAAPSPGASISQIANFQQAQDRGATAVAAKPVAAKPAPAQTKSAAGAQAFGAMASQLGGIGGVENLPSQTYAAKTTTTPGDTLKKNAVAQAAGTSGPVPTGSADDVNVLDPDVIASMTKDQEKSAMTEAYREGDPNQGSLNWTALIKSWSARLPSVDWKFGEKKSMRLYQPQMYALLQVIGNLHNAVEQEDIIQNVFSVRQRVDDLLNDTVTKQYMAHYAKWQQEQLEKQQQNQAQQSLLEPTGQPAEKGIEPEPKQGELFKEDSWHAGDNSWSSEHDQWARESTTPASPKDTIQRYLAIDKQTDVEAVKAAIHAISNDPALKPTTKSRYLGYIGMIVNRHRLPIGRAYYQFMQKFMENRDVTENIDELKKKMSKLETLALAANRAGDDVKCKMYQEKIQAIKQKLSQSMAEGWSDAVVARRTGQPRTPYSVYIKGRKWKDFDNDDHAQAVADKLRAKFKADGRDPETITIAPTDISVSEAEDRVDPILIRALVRMPDGLASHKEVLDAARDAYAMELGLMKMKSDYGVTQSYIPQLLDLYKKKHGLTFNEAETDYSKRRARERDIDAGRPVPKQRPSKMTDYQKRRAQDRKDMELGETTNYWTRLQQERFLKEHKKAFDLVAELEQSIKDIK